MSDTMLDKLEDMGAEVEDTLERLMDDEELYLEYLQQLPDNQNIVALRTAVAQKDSAAAEREVHTLKGVALNLGLLPLVDVCMDMLLELRAGKPEEGFAVMPEIDAVFEQCTAIIREG